jgi:hypothetical protein
MLILHQGAGSRLGPSALQPLSHTASAIDHLILQSDTSLNPYDGRA